MEKSCNKMPQLIWSKSRLSAAEYPWLSQAACELRFALQGFVVLKTLFAVARINFLSLTLVCVALAAVAAWHAGAALQLDALTMIGVMALCAHISVNAFNEFFDFRSGLDFLTQRTPFSGGSGGLVANPSASHLALILALATLALVIGIGLYFALQIGWRLLWIGIPGVLLIFAYTQYINRWPLLCLMAPGLGFGLMMTLGSFWVLNGQITIGAVSVSLIVALLVSNLLLLNQFPDVAADAQVGRRHLPIVIGRKRSAVLFGLLWLFSYAILLLAVWQQWLPAQALLALVTAPLLGILLPQVRRYADEPERLVPFMALNVALCHVYPLLLMVGLWWAAMAGD